MPSVSIPAATLGSGILSAGTSIFGGSKQESAAQSAQNNQLAMFNQTQQNLAPYMSAGQQGLGLYQGLLGVGGPSGGSTGAPDSAATLASIKKGLQSWDAAKPGNAGGVLQMIDQGASLGQVQSALSTLRTTTTNPSNTKFLDPLIQQANNPVMGQGAAANPNDPSGMMSRLAQTPGYQFALQQGLQATQNGFAAQGLGQSGAAIKGAGQYAEGLASTTYQQQVQNAQQLAGMGQNAAAGLGTLGQQAGQIAGNFGTSGAAAGAAGVVGAGNALGGAATSAALWNQIPQQLGMFGGSAAGAGQFSGQTPQINSNTFTPTYTPTGYAYGSP